MNYSKKIFLICLLLIMLGSIASVSAANDTQVVLSEDGESGVEIFDVSYKASDDLEVASEEKNF